MPARSQQLLGDARDPKPPRKTGSNRPKRSHSDDSGVQGSRRSVAARLCSRKTHRSTSRGSWLSLGDGSWAPGFGALSLHGFARFFAKDFEDALDTRLTESAEAPEVGSSNTYGLGAYR